MKTKIKAMHHLGRKRYHVSAADKEFYLSDKESGVIFWLKEGLRPKEIAWQLTTSLSTVNTHLTNIKIKLGCVSIFQLGLILGKLNAIEKNELEAELETNLFIEDFEEQPESSVESDLEFNYDSEPESENN